MIASRSYRPSLLGAFRGEALKVSRQLSVWLMIAGAFVLLAVIVLASTTADFLRNDIQKNPTTFVGDVIQLYGTVFLIGSGIAILIVATRLMAMEYSGPIRILYARGFGRLQLLLVKMAASIVFGLLLLAGYALLVALITLGYGQAWAGGTSFLSHVSAAGWQDVERTILFAAANVVVLVLVAAAASGLGRSLTFALPAAMVLFPADNFASIICALLARVTGHKFPWLDINQWFLGPNLNNVLPLWLNSHPRPAFATPLVTVNLTHTVLVIGAWCLGLAAVAVGRAVRPDVLE